jgi:hypothetical protein
MDLPCRLLRIRIATDRLLLAGRLVGVLGGRLVARRLVRIVPGLVPLGMIDRLPGIAVAAGVLRVPGADGELGQE